MSAVSTEAFCASPQRGSLMRRHAQARRSAAVVRTAPREGPEALPPVERARTYGLDPSPQVGLHRGP